MSIASYQPDRNKPSQKSIPKMDSMATGASPYEWIKNLAKEAGENIPDLLALSRNNDPFVAGTPAHIRDAEWFAEVWERYGFEEGTHLRRVHYLLVSHGGVTGSSGKPYENTEGCWNDLCTAGRYARYLGLVAPEMFADRRNPEPRLYMTPREEEPGWVYDFKDWTLPRIQSKLSAYMPMPETWVTGYEYENNLQPYHVEVWCEKSTMNDELRPLCEIHGVNLITGVGFMSITSVVELLGRVESLDKPCRILYISDFDPAGSGMPVGVARQIEFGLLRYSGDIRLEPLILTPEQVRRYSLPRTPVKDEDKRRGKWEAIHGAGAVELDALQALHPGEFARLVQEGIMSFRDVNLPREARKTEREAQNTLEREIEEARSEYREEVSEIHSEVSEITSRYEQRLEELNDALQAELAHYLPRMETLRHDIQIQVDDARPELPDLPEGHAEPDDEGWLFDSRRDYMDQLDAYKSRQRGE